MANDLAGSNLSPSMARDKVDQVARASHEAVESMASKAGPALDDMQDKAEELEALKDRWSEGARDYVRQHPVVSIAAGLTAGMLLGRLLR